MQQISLYELTLNMLKEKGLVHDAHPESQDGKFEVFFHLDFGARSCWVRAEDLGEVLKANHGVLFHILEDNYAIALADLYPLKHEVYVLPSYQMGMDVTRVEFNQLIPTLAQANSIYTTLLVDLNTVLALPQNVGKRDLFRLYFADGPFTFVATEEAYIRILGFLLKMGLPLSTLLQATASRDACRGPRPTFTKDITGVNLWNYIKYHKAWWWKIVMRFGPKNVFSTIK